jgi:hypothetical protein
VVSVYVFDVLRHHGVDVIDWPWTDRRALLDQLDLVAATAGRVRPVVYSADGTALRAAVTAAGGEGVVQKRPPAPIGRGPDPKLGRRQKPESSIGCLVIVENDTPLGVATLSPPDPQRHAQLLCRPGRHHPTGTVTIPDGIEVEARYTTRTPTNGRLREPSAIDLRPASQPQEAFLKRIR